MDRFFLAWVICIICTYLTAEILCLVAPFLNSYYSLLSNIVLCFVIGHWFFLFTKRSLFKKRINPNKKAVFITGCDSGFGFQLAKRLDSKGFHVFAGCLFPSSRDAVELKNSCSSRFHTVHIDVTKDVSISNAKEFVKENLGDSELWAVVNNAGVYKGFAVEFSPLSDFIDSFQVNTLGQVRVTKAFLALIRNSKGRIINVNSLAGRAALPHMSCYTMSKFAAVAFTECLRREMDTCGVKVISIEPEFFKTPMTKSENLINQLEKTTASMEETTDSSFGKKLTKRMKLLYMRWDKLTSINVHLVIDAMEASVSMQYPCTVYQPCGNTMRQILLYLFIRLPDPIFDVFIRLLTAAQPLLGRVCY